MEFTMKVRLAPDYECPPTWEGEGHEFGNVDPQELPIPPALVEEIRVWAARYEATYNRADPVSSRFSSPADEEDFDREGRRLWRALQESLGPQHEVSYHSVVTGWEDKTSEARA
jgi:hypothetical protein